MISPRDIDHVAIVVEDLDATAAYYDAAGFSLTPRAWHSDEMGTSNRLVQFAERSFIELIEVDRPTILAEHALDATPPRFSFGAHNRDFISKGRGMSMLCMTTSDTRADLSQFAALGLKTYEPYYFEREARLPDDSRVTVAFTLGFMTTPTMPSMAFFICQQHAPEYFWKPEFQTHANGATAIEAIFIAAHEPDRHVSFLTTLTGGKSERVRGGFRIGLKSHELFVLTQAECEKIRGSACLKLDQPAKFVGLTLRTEEPPKRSLDEVEEASGIFVNWRVA